MTTEENVSRRRVFLSFLAVYAVAAAALPLLGIMKDGDHTFANCCFGLVLILVSLVTFPLGLLGIAPDLHNRPEVLAYLLGGLSYLAYAVMFCLMIRYRKRYQFIFLMVGLIMLLALTLKGCSVQGTRTANHAGL